MSENPQAERERRIEEAIQGANLKDSQGEHFRNLLDRLERDDEALIVLKGHLVIEERITAAIEKFVWHAEYIEPREADVRSQDAPRPRDLDGPPPEHHVGPDRQAERRAE